jgi:hypothetical protein
MAVVSVTLTVQATCHYWLYPQASVDLTGLGISLPDIVNGQVIEPADETASQLVLELDNSYLWNVDLRFLNAPPILFDGFAPGTGGDLLVLLTAQGWVPL